MISSRLYGGLGNYMFQIAAAEAHAVSNGSESIFCYNNARQVHGHITSYSNNIFSKLKIDCSPHYASLYKEPHFHYSQIPSGKSILLDGYFQSEKYFIDFREWILDIFEPTLEVKKYIEEKYNNILNSNSCSIHVRRGDFAKLSQFHPVLEKNYYMQSIIRMNSINRDTKFIIFSDDIEWCKSNFQGDIFTFIEGERDYIDLYLMSMCQNNIIANSSFSWWAAWLNNNKDKKIIAPKKWFGPALSHDISDLIPNEWSVI